MSDCIYRSVTLAPGESYVLPAGATVVSSSNTSTISSTCPLPALEELTCYAIIIPFRDEETIGASYENDVTSIVSFYIGNTEYTLTNPIGEANVNPPITGGAGWSITTNPANAPFPNLQSAIITQSPAGFIGSLIDLYCYRLPNSLFGSYNGPIIIYFKQAPSVGSEIKVKIRTKYSYGNPLPGDTYQYYTIDAKSFDQINADPHIEAAAKTAITSNYPSCTPA